MEKMYLINFILTCTIFACVGSSVHGCPNQCSCRDTAVNCKNRNITTVPFNIAHSTTELYLQLNKITSLDGNSFEQLTALDYLDLSFNIISTIHANLFRGLAVLRYLYLNGNQITTMDGNLFQDLTALQILYLHKNQISTLDNNLFRGLTALRTLYLSYNKLTTLHVNLFRGLAALKYLYLHNNQIATFNGNIFKGLTALNKLYLENNPLDCSKCELKKLKEFLQHKTNLVVSGALCENKKLINHNFTNCKEMTTEHTEEISTVSQQQTSLIISSAKSDTTEAFPSSATIDNPARTTQSTTGIINTEVIIYLSCGVSFFLILSCSMACFYGGKTYQKAHINQNVGINQIIDLNNREIDEDSDAEISLNILTERGSGYGYAEIDELEMSEFILIPLEQLHLVHDDSSSDSYDGIRPPSDGYLNPYQSLLHSLQQSGNDQEDSDEYIHPDEENRAYTNLYQSLRYNRPHDLRQYASCASVQYFMS